MPDMLSNTSFEARRGLQPRRLRFGRRQGIRYGKKTLRTGLQIPSGFGPSATPTKAVARLSHNAQASLARFPTWDECSASILKAYRAIARNAVR